MALTTGPTMRRILIILRLTTLCLLVSPERSLAEIAHEPPSIWRQTANGGARITGKISLAPILPSTGRLPVFKNRGFCGPSVPDETLLTSEDGGLRNAIVLLHPLDRIARVQPGRVVLDNIKCAFAPHVQVASVGSELSLKNSDPILHTVHARLGQETLFNVGLPQWRQVTKILERPGVVRINCDVLHTWMTAAIVVATTPHFSISDQKGLFAVDHLPAGAYDVVVWHEKLGTKIRRISLNEDTSLSLDVVFGLAQEKR